MLKILDFIGDTIGGLAKLAFLIALLIGIFAAPFVLATLLGTYLVGF